MAFDLLGGLTAGSTLAGTVDSIITNRKNFDLQKENLAYQKDLQKQIFAREDNAVQRRVEDLRKAGLSPVLAAGSADFISKHFFGLNPVFNFTSTTALPLKNYWLLLFLGVLLGVLGAFYNWATLLTQKLYGKLKVSTSTKLLIPFALAGILGLIFPVLLCGGHAALEEFSLSNDIFNTYNIVLIGGKFIYVD